MPKPRFKDWREGRRFRALELQGQGWSVTDIARALGVSKSAVSQWLCKAREQGAEALRAQSHPGHPPRLTSQEQARLPELIAQGPQAYGFRGDVWTRRRVAELIRREFGISYSVWQVGRILHRLRHSVQKPLVRATERDEAAIEAWQGEGLAALEKKGT